MVEVDILEPGDPRWGELLRHTVHDFYHLPGYIELSARLEGGEPRAFWAKTDNCELLIPVLLRAMPEELEAPPDWQDALTPYGYPGPVVRYPEPCDSEEKDRKLKDCLKGFRALCEDRQIVSVFCRMHPLIEISYQPFSDLGELVQHGQTVYVDFRVPEDQIKSQIRRSIRKKVRGILREGYLVEIDNFDHIKEFIPAYHSSMRRLSAEDFYFFPESYFNDLIDLLGENIHLVSILSPQGDFASGILLTDVNGLLQGHLSGTVDEFAGKSLNKLAFHAMIEWGQSQRKWVLHLGGGIGGKTDSLFQFKTGFSKFRADFKTWRYVVDADRYNQLVKSASRINSELDSESDFFPLYRSLD
jgi:hypothetical protein